MALLMQILSGSQADLKFLLKEGIRIGRTQGEIQILDSKISSLHGIVEADDKGLLTLRDLNSSNGIYINERRVKKVLLSPGVSFLIGATPVKVILVADSEIDQHVIRISWRSALKLQLEKLRISSTPPPDLLQPLNPTLMLTVTHGPIADKNICLGYAPRHIGRDMLDIEIADPDAPPHAVDILPPKAGGGVTIVNKGGSQVKVNSHPFISHEIRDGDQLQIGNSIIRFYFS